MSLSVVASLFLALRVPLGAPAPRASRAAVSMQLGNPLDLLSEAGEKAAKAAAEAAETATKAATSAMGSQAGDLFRKMTGSDESLGGLSKEEAEEMANYPAFKANPVNPAVMESSGQLGVPRVAPKAITKPREFMLTTASRVKVKEDDASSDAGSTASAPARYQFKAASSASGLPRT